METAGQVEAVVFDAIDRRESLVAERVPSELGEAPRLAVVEKRRVGSELRGPGLLVAHLQGCHGATYSWVCELGDIHETSPHSFSPTSFRVPSLRTAGNRRPWKSKLRSGARALTVFLARAHDRRQGAKPSQRAYPCPCAYE